MYRHEHLCIDNPAPFTPYSIVFTIVSILHKSILPPSYAIPYLRIVYLLCIHSFLSTLYIEKLVVQRAALFSLSLLKYMYSEYVPFDLVKHWCYPVHLPESKIERSSAP